MRRLFLRIFGFSRPIRLIAAFPVPLPFSSAPKFMPYRELGMGGPPPGPVPPPPANYPLGSLANKPPPLPPPPMPPPMMPYG